MEAFTNPVADFTDDHPIEKLPPNTTLEHEPQTNTLTAKFKSFTIRQWSWILGERLCLVFVAFHHTSRLVFCLAPHFHPEAFMKAIHFRVNDSLIKRVTGNANKMSTIFVAKNNVTCDMGISYVGAKSFIADTNVFIDGVETCKVRTLGIVIDPTTRRPGGPLDAAWRENALEAFERNGLANEKLDFPEYPTRRTLRHSLTMTVRENHMDYNNHTNYTFYPFGSIVCFRKALESGNIPGFSQVDFNNLIVRDFTTVFEDECTLGDEVKFELVQTEEGILFTACYCGEKRLSYTKLEIMNLELESKM